MDDLIQTPYGRVQATALENLRSMFDTTELLKVVDDLDRLCAQWKNELRDDLLHVHAMAHTLINDAPVSCAPGEEGVGELAATLTEEFQDCRAVLRSAIALLDQIATLAPD
jgi:hypothetical protein